MKQNFKFIVPALMALSMFAFAPAYAGEGENGKNDPQPPSHGKNDPQPTSDGKNDPQPPSHGKNDPQPPAPPTPPTTPPTRGGDGGGNSGNYGVGNVVTCVINGRVFKVRSVKQCYVQPSYGEYQVRPPVYHAQKHKKHRRMMVSGGVSGGGYVYGGGYGYDQQPVVRYYQPASRAAIMQQQKRARRAAAAYGYVQDGGMGYGGGFVVQGGYGYDSGYVVTRKKSRRVRQQAPIYMPSYDQGYVIHYGPTMSKGGGY